MPGRRARLILLALPLLALGIAVAVGAAPTAGNVERAVSGVGTLAPIAFVGFYMAWTVLVLPGSVVTLASGALFGFFAGSLVALIGADAGATLAFLLARRAGRRGQAEGANPRVARAEGWLRDHGFAALLSARLMPGLPFNVLNYAAGVAGLSTRSYVFATAIGIVPGTLSTVAVGSSLTHRVPLGWIVVLYGVRVGAILIIWLDRRRRSGGRRAGVLADPAAAYRADHPDSRVDRGGRHHDPR